MSHISESLPQKEIVVTVILDSNDVREKISGCVFQFLVASPPSLSFVDRIFKSCPTDMRVCIRRVSSTTLSFAG